MHFLMASRAVRICAARWQQLSLIRND